MAANQPLYIVIQTPGNKASDATWCQLTLRATREMNITKFFGSCKFYKFPKMQRYNDRIIMYNLIMNAVIRYTIINAVVHSNTKINAVRQYTIRYIQIL